MIQMTLGELRQLEALAEKAREKAKSQIAAAQDTAFYFFEYTDQIPEGWSRDLGESTDAFCEKCVTRIKKKPAVKKQLASIPDYDGPRGYSSEEGESSRNCFGCGCPLPWAMLEYGMESELDHFETADPVSPNDWYWLFKLAEECLGCETYLNEYGQRVRRVLVAAFLGKNHHSYAIEK